MASAQCKEQQKIEQLEADLRRSQEAYLRLADRVDELEAANLTLKARADNALHRLHRYRRENMELRLRALDFFQQRRVLRKALRAATGSGFVD